MHEKGEMAEILSKKIRSIFSEEEKKNTTIEEKIYFNNLRRSLEKEFIPSHHEKKEFAEFTTPIPLVDKMLDTIPTTFWEKQHTVFEPCCGKGAFILAIFDRFYKGMIWEKSKHISDIEKCRIIIEKCLYFGDIVEKNVFITRQILIEYCKYLLRRKRGIGEGRENCAGESEGDEEILHNQIEKFRFNWYVGDTTIFCPSKIVFRNKLTHFDAVIGNPPYSTDPALPNPKQLYHLYVNTYMDIGDILLFVVPSRWFAGGTKTLHQFRSSFQQRRDIVSITHTDDSEEWFGNKVHIKGGCCFFLKDKAYSGDCVFNGIPYPLNKYADCIIQPKYHPLVDIVIQHKRPSVATLYQGRCFHIETNDERFIDDGPIKCYVSSKKDSFRIKYIAEYNFTEENSFWKVVTPESAYWEHSGFGELFIARPEEVHSGSYVNFRVNSEAEAESLLSYLATRFANYLLSIRKVSQHINTQSLKWIPLVPLDRFWTDEEVCEYFQIDPALIGDTSSPNT